MREQIAEGLVGAIKTALASYHAFTDISGAQDAADFKKHHDAAKAALSHIELLMKLGESICTGHEDEFDNAMLAQMIEAAHAEVDKNKGKAYE
mgnify:CR=1 FL=1|jgi:hypothetical protein